jgi:hypothetical protein
MRAKLIPSRDELSRFTQLFAGRAKVKILHGRGAMLRRAIEELEARPTAFLPRMVWFSNHKELEPIFGKQVYE